MRLVAPTIENRTVALAAPTSAGMPRSPRLLRRLTAARSQILVPLGIGPQRGGDKGEIVTQPALSKAALRPQLEALLANYHGPVTHCPPALQPEPEPEALDLDDDNGCGNHESN